MKRRTLCKILTSTMSAGAVLLWVTIAMNAQSNTTKGEWPTYGGDLRSTRYTPLSQITRDNFSKLAVAWRFKTDNLGPRPEFNLQSTPLMVNGVLYSTAGTRRAVVALDPVTGELKWVYGFSEGKRGVTAPRPLSGRGLAYWTDGREERIIYVTPGYQMIALDARTGRPVSTFGKSGIVDLKLDLDQEAIDIVNSDIGFQSAPVVAGDTVVIGAAHLPGLEPPSRTNVKGFVRGYDARTGKRLWIFHTIPSLGEFGSETWERDSQSYTGNTGVWAQITVDEQLGLVYLPVETPTGDNYGGHRPGANLFGNSLVAVDLKTGKRVWYFQFTHHDMWDWDLPCAPILANITVEGRPIRAIAQATKQGWVYVFDRATGQPVWPIVERPVPKGDTPGEWYSPTQPFPTKPPPFARQGVTIDDLIDFTPEMRKTAVEIVSHYKIGPIFTPPVVSKWEGPLATLMNPPIGGAQTWPGGALDPESNIFYVYAISSISAIGLTKPEPGRSDMDWVVGMAKNPATSKSAPAAPPAPLGGASPPTPIVDGLPLLKPPYATMTAIDLNQGAILWQVPHGDTPDLVRNHPALKGLTIPRTGRIGKIGTLVTKTLVIAGEGGFNTTASGARGAMLRAYDKMTGADAGAVFMPAPQSGSPMSYMANGKQYIVVAISGGNYTGELVAYRLPD